jgi:HPr kinase/phosphorylase
MTNLSKILSLENVLLDLEVSSKKRAFEQAGLIFENNCGIARSTVSDNLFARERLGSTGLGHGVAVPHGRIKGSKSLKSPLAAFVRLAEPIPFESPDGQPVKLLFFLLIPDHVTQQHLEILSEIAEMFSDESRPHGAGDRSRPALGPRAHHQLATEPAGPGLNVHAANAADHTTAVRRQSREPQLGWFAGFPGGERLISGDVASAADQVGHLNLIHPGRIQVFGHQELNYYHRLKSSSRSHVIGELIAGGPPALIIAQGLDTPPDILAICDEQNIPLFSTPLPAAQVIDFLRVYLSKKLAQRIIMHGVFMDVLGVGVLITGDSGLGKSELGLELISRSHGLVADDAVEFSRIAPNMIEGRCPPLLQNLLEVRGLGLLDIKAIFGETAVRRKMRLKLIVHLVRRSALEEEVERLPFLFPTEDVLGLPVRKVVIPVAAGRNIAVLLEAAVRNTILQLRGIDTLQEFMERQRQAMSGD